MGLFDFVTDLVGDVVGSVVESATDLVGDVVGSVVESATDLVGDVVGGVKDGILGEAVEEVIETGAHVATGAVVGFVGGVQKGINQRGKKGTKRSAKNEEEFDDYAELEDFEDKSDFQQLPPVSVLAAETESRTVRANGSNGKKLSTAGTMKSESIKISPTNELLVSLKKLRETEDRKIDQIKKSGDNMIANVADSFFSSPKRSKFLSITKSITGKTNDEKLIELRDDYDEKRAKCIDRVIVPIDALEMWEMYEAAIRLVKQPGMGKKEKTACRNLLERVIEECEIKFSDSEEKLAVIGKSKQKIYGIN